MPHKTFLAVDLGAASGRVVAGIFDGDRLTLGEVHRFANGPVNFNGRLYWRTFELWGQVLAGLRLAARELGESVASVGVDAWGVDFALIDQRGELLAAPVAYRDLRTRGELDRAFAVVPRDEIYAETGLQFLELNTLYQLLAAKRLGSPPLDRAARLLMMPDLFHWLLTGVAANEQTIASTTQLYNPRSRAWSDALIERFGLPREIFGPLAEPGATLGPLLPAVADETGLRNVNVVLPGSHDTASAVLAVPAKGNAPLPSPRRGGDGGGAAALVHASAPLPSPPRKGEGAGTCLSRHLSPAWAYISSGTWSLMGIESAAPTISEQAFRWNFTNEGGVAGTTRVLKNISGMWILQECQRVWNAQGREYDWATMMRLAEEARPLEAAIDPDAPQLLAPSDMPGEIVALCRQSGQPAPETHGAIVRCALESLALKYRQVLGKLEELGGRTIEQIHIVGGGAQNRLLCQMAADACQRAVLAGPVEATAIGNILMQAIASGEIAGIAEAREVIHRSFEVAEYHPQEDGRWAEAADRLSTPLAAGQ